jgi:hypothetical protein
MTKNGQQDTVKHGYGENVYKEFTGTMKIFSVVLTEGT